MVEDMHISSHETNVERITQLIQAVYVRILFEPPPVSGCTKQSTRTEIRYLLQTISRSISKVLKRHKRRVGSSVPSVDIE